MLLKESMLLSRSVFVVDREGKIRYIQIVPDISHEPDYEAVLEALRPLR